MDYVKLAAELLAGHPDTGAYSEDPEVAAAQGNLVNREEPVDSITGQQLVRAVVPADFTGLSDRQEARFWGICGLGDIPVNDANIKAALVAMFGGTETLTNLAALQTRMVTRFQELRLGFLYPGHIENARMM